MREVTSQFLTPVFSLAILFAVTYLLPKLVPLLKLIPRVAYFGGFSLVAFLGIAMFATAPSLAGAAGTAVALSLGLWYAIGAVRHYRTLLKQVSLKRPTGSK
jgi:hypothetical protein